MKTLTNENSRLVSQNAILLPIALKTTAIASKTQRSSNNWSKIAKNMKSPNLSVNSKMK